MKYFNKEYIKEADCEEIQGLRKKRLLKYDFYIEADTISRTIQNLNADSIPIGSRIWLPTGDQLDEEIQKICDKTYLRYRVEYQHIKIKLKPYRKEWYVYVDTVPKLCISNINPLIAKVKLLKQLLKESEEK